MHRSLDTQGFPLGSGVKVQGMHHLSDTQVLSLGAGTKSARRGQHSKMGRNAAQSLLWAM